MIGLLGGTFDPIHLGHIQLAREVREAVGLAGVEFIPCRYPVHRDSPSVSAQQRLRMVELALSGIDGFNANPVELERDAPSYAIDTLQTLKQQNPQQTLCWMMGSDAYNGFERWKNPQGILQLANLIVCTRPGSEIENDAFAAHRVESPEALRQRQAGGILFHPMRPNSCSATEVRQALRTGAAVSGCLSPPVINFIQQFHLYES